MRRVLKIALATAVLGFAAAATPVAAQSLTQADLVATYSGIQCNGGPIIDCYAPSLTQVGPNGTPVPGETPGIGSFGPGTVTTTDFSDWITVATNGDNILNFDYTGSEVATYIGVFQGGSGLNCADCQNTYQLFYDATGITSGTIDLNTFFTNNTNISHVDLFDHGGAVPEPATWGMMLLGFAGIGMAMRRSRRRIGALMQVA